MGERKPSLVVIIYSAIPNKSVYTAIYFVIFTNIFLIRRNFLCNTQKVLCNTLHVYSALHGYLEVQSRTEVDQILSMSIHDENFKYKIINFSN